jgi:release factor glutamine methyltransferase
MRVCDALDEGVQVLPDRPGIPDPRREALWLLARAWGRGELDVRLALHDQVPAEVERTYRRWLERRAAGEPAHHLTGWCPFWGRDFRVSPHVLVPRPETELVVESALGLPLRPDARVLDVGTGSGCLAATLALERPGWRVVAVDVSVAALVVARMNIRHHRAAVALVAGDLAGAIGGRVDLVVANLPYVPALLLGRVPVEVGYDPVIALDGGGDGLDVIRRLLESCPRVLAAGGRVVLEVGDDQADAVAADGARAGLGEERRVVDVGGCERVLVLRQPSG